ncbi:aminotransferase class V-fold PLP-dependent enzyme [Microbispora sp. RL4-1S]|uniref:Aminotransferase class V-fold PLP-dependent enzyme n=1 Tax=Microbispora oryzae TaxID=2806554 RepID=A0A941APK7_9ACTN|nr:aminotransferase class V-fold PLP-dependent enzyme [Microbispora oryzae]MBP2703799.1 aminotransferase class V-fold PLP-dependent enzyme [Microbispora oryzae]
MGIDVEKARADTAGCEQVVHFNNAGASLPPRPVMDAVVRYLRMEERLGGYEVEAAEWGRLEHAYEALARLVGAGPDEIAVVENATRAWDMAFYSLRWKEGDRVLTTAAEYASNVIPFLQIARRHGVRVDVVPADASGAPSVEALESMIDDRVKLIALTHVPTQGGLVSPAAEIGRVARRAGITYLLDACQSVGQLRVDVREIGCDLLSATGRKFLRGPRGTGFLYCSRRILDSLEPPFLDLHAAPWTSAGSYTVRDDARRFESWEGYRAGKIGLAVAADYACDLGLDAIEERITGLGEGLRERLRAVPGVSVHDQGTRRCGIVTFTVAGHDSADVVALLRERGINVSVSRPGSARWDFEARGLPPMVRASVHYYNTEDELDRLCAALPA